MEAVTTVDLLRHGACCGGDILRGVTDDPLSQEGWQQMQGAVDADGPWQRIVTSPLQRCRLFAERCAESWHVPLVVVEAFREMDFGRWDGRELHELWESEPQRIGRFYEHPLSVTPPGGEPVADVGLRVSTAWRQMLETGRGESLLLVTHAGVIRLLLAQLLEMPLSGIHRIDVPHGALTRISIYHRQNGDFPVLRAHRVPPFRVEA